MLALLLLFIGIPVYLYVSSIDWSKSHTQRIALLPKFDSTQLDGKYRLSVKQNEFVVRTWGMQNRGKNVILLHGFPESSLMWESFAKKLAQSGYCVLAFDQRGYSPNARPSNVEDYALKNLANDVFEVADQVGFEQFNLVGHDWGAMVGWKAVMDKPERIQTWTALSIPHPAVFFDAVVNDSIQRKKSEYMQLFRKPILPEFLLTYKHQAAMKGILAKLPATQTSEYLAIMAEPGAMTAELNWYRALDVEKEVKNKSFEKSINVPTLFIVGTEDGVVSAEIIPRQRKYMTGRFQSMDIKTGHNLIQQEEKVVLEALLKHLQVN